MGEGVAGGMAAWGADAEPSGGMSPLAGWPMLERCGATGCVGVAVCPWKR